MPLRGGVRARSLYSVAFNPATTGDLSGVQALAGGGAVGGGFVEIRNQANTAVLFTQSIAGDGTYSKTGLTPGTYTLMPHPPGTHSMGAGQPDTVQVTIVAGQMKTQDFVVQAAVAFDDFQSYTQDANFTRWATGTQQAGDFFFGTNHNVHVDDPTNVHFDGAGGTGGRKSLRIDWPASPNGGANTRAVKPELGNFGTILGAQEFWVRLRKKYSVGFDIGATNQGTWEFKDQIYDLTIPGNVPSVGSFYLEQDPQTAAPFTSGATLVQARYKFANGGDALDTVTDPNDPNINFPGSANWAGDDTDLPASYLQGGAYHTWVHRFFGFNSGAGGNVSWSSYLDGAFVRTITGPFKGTTNSLAAASVLLCEITANMNNGPDNAQSLWVEEFGVYRTRPSLRHALAV